MKVLFVIALILAVAVCQFSGFASSRSSSRSASRRPAIIRPRNWDNLARRFDMPWRSNSVRRSSSSRSGSGSARFLQTGWWDRTKAWFSKSRSTSVWRSSSRRSRWSVRVLQQSSASISASKSRKNRWEDWTSKWRTSWGISLPKSRSGRKWEDWTSKWRTSWALSVPKPTGGISWDEYKSRFGIRSRRSAPRSSRSGSASARLLQTGWWDRTKAWFSKSRSTSVWRSSSRRSRWSVRVLQQSSSSGSASKSTSGRKWNDWTSKWRTSWGISLPKSRGGRKWEDWTAKWRSNLGSVSWRNPFTRSRSISRRAPRSSRSGSGSARLLQTGWWDRAKGWFSKSASRSVVRSRWISSRSRWN